jgi:hypothetical protein
MLGAIMLSVVMLRIIMPGVVMLMAVMLNVMAPITGLYSSPNFSLESNKLERLLLQILTA